MLIFLLDVSLVGHGGPYENLEVPALRKRRIPNGIKPAPNFELSKQELIKCSKF